MGKRRVTISFSFLGLILAGSLAASSCGAGQSQSQLQSMSISPATANAEDYPNGEVQFTATGFYVHPTRTITPQSATWVACQGSGVMGTVTNDVSVTSTGVAQCRAGVTGTFSINAWNATSGPGTLDCPAGNACGGGCTVEATAQLTCP